MGKASRVKGYGFERAVAIALRGVFPNARRQLEYQANQCMGTDIAETGKYRIQCKKLRKYAPISKITEVIYSEGECPVLVTAGDRMPPMAVIPFEEFIRLVDCASRLAANESPGHEQRVGVPLA